MLSTKGLLMELGNWEDGIEIKGYEIHDRECEKNALCLQRVS